MIFLWDFCGISMVFSLRVSMLFAFYFHDLSMDSMGFPMGC